VKVTIRPERVVLEDAGATGENRVPGMVERTVYVGSIMQILVNLANGAQIQAWIPNDGVRQLYPSGTAVGVFMPRDALRVLPDAGTPVLAGDELDEH
jgi:mannopine transport system ATP-binding protein